MAPRRPKASPAATSRSTPPSASRWPKRFTNPDTRTAALDTALSTSELYWKQAPPSGSSKISVLPTAATPLPDPAVAEIEDLSFAYDNGQPVLHHIRLNIPRGKVVAVMGQSGCGKTTLLRIIAAALLPTQGSARVLGQDTRALDRDGLYALRRRLGMLFQFGALFTDLSVFENIAFPLREHTDLSEDLVRDLVLMKLNAVGLRGSAQLRPSELSGGMARRVALARAIALDPMLVMYDEPFAGLDPISLGIVGQLIRKMNDALGITSVVVTHDVYESLKIVDYLYFVSEGRIVAQGTPDEVRASRDPFVRQFVDGEADGPVPFHVAAPPLDSAFALDHAG